MTDGDLVRQAGKGNRTACETLVRRWSARVLAVCHARVGRHHVAEDLAQEALLRGIRGLSTLAEPEKFGPWLCGIATRVCLDWCKARQSSQVPFTALSPGGRMDDLLTGSGDAEAAVDQADEVRRVMEAVDELPEKQREVLLLFYYQEATYHDLAEMLGVSSATINARLTQARAALRERLGSLRR